MKRKLFSARVLGLLGATAIGACGSQGSDVASTSQRVMQSREIDNQYRDVGWLESRTRIGGCTGTAISDRIVVTAAHCLEWKLVMTPGVDDRMSDIARARADHVFTVDLDGDRRSTTDTFSYEIGQVYGMSGEIGPSGQRERWDLVVLGLEIPPGTLGPLSRARTVGPVTPRRLLTSYVDNATPPDLADLVVHSQFNPFTVLPDLPIQRVGVGGNDVVFLPDGGIDPDASSGRPADGGPPSEGAFNLQLRQLAPGKITSLEQQPASTLPMPASDRIGGIASRSPDTLSPYNFPGDSGGPLLASSFPNVPAGTDTLIGVLGTTTAVLPPTILTMESTHGGFFTPRIRSWIEGRLRDLKNDADYDGIPDAQDNCITVRNPLQQDSNFEAEYELTCRAGACAPNMGAPPSATASPAQIAAWHASFVGDACDPNRVARLSVASSMTLVQTTGTCTNYIDKFSIKVPYQGACYFQAENDLLVSDGVGLPAGVTGPTRGNVAHYACNCDPSLYANIADENQRLIQCSLPPNNCKIALDSAVPPDSLWLPNRYNSVSETDVKRSEGGTSRGPLVFFPAETTTDSRYGNRRGQRTARWDLGADRGRMGLPAAGSYSGMLWSKAGPTSTVFGVPPEYVPAADTPNDYALSTNSRAIAGKTTFGGPLVPIARIPWFEWIMNPGAHRGELAETLVPVRVNTESVRVFSFGADGIRDVSTRFTSAARDRLARLETGTSVLALPAADVRSVLPDAGNRAVSMNATTGAVDGVFRIANGLTTWTAVSESFTLGAAPSAASFEPLTGTLTVIADGRLYRRTWTSDGFGPPVQVAMVPGVPYLSRPTATGTRLLTQPEPGVLAMVETSGPDLMELGKWAVAVDTEIWPSTGRRGETFIAFRRKDGIGGVLVFEDAGVTGYGVEAVAGPAAADFSGGITIMTDVRDGTAAPVVVTLATTDRVDETKITGTLAGF